MIIYIGADHRGFNLKESLKNHLKQSGYEVVDVGNDHYDKDDDFPDFAIPLAKEISADPDGRRGILICGSGVGMDVAANRVAGVRSALAATPDQAYMSRNDTDTNVLSLAADFLSEDQAKKILAVWLETPFAGDERYRRRLDKIREINES